MLNLLQPASGEPPEIKATRKQGLHGLPIVMTGDGTGPVEAGLVDSLAHPGGNVTGITNLSEELGGKRLALLKEAVPKVTRVAVLYEPAVPALRST